jgi:hypothetical protein
MENQPAFYAYNYGANIEIELNKLRTKLEQKYTLNNISSILYALAVNIKYADINSPNPNNKLIYYLLADRNKVLGEF